MLPDCSFRAIRAVCCGLVRLTLALAIALPFAVGWASMPEAKTSHVVFNEPALSPNGRSVAVQAWVPGHSRSKLVLLDVETGSVRAFDQPRDQTWRSPSFSPSGDRLAFLRICRFECASGPKGVHIGVLDLQSSRDTTATATSDLIRMDPVFAPGGRFVVYGAVQIDDVDQRSFPKSIYNRAYGFYTRSLLIVDLETGIESEILPGKGKEAQFMRTRPAGFLDEKTLVIRGKIVFEEDLHKQLEQRVKHVRAIIGYSPDDEDYLYLIGFDKSFSAVSEAPKATGLELYETDWVRPVSHQVIEPGVVISFDTGVMAFVDRSNRSRQLCLFGCTREYDLFVGNKATIRQVTSFHAKKMYDATISKSGNRVAFLIKDDDSNWELWIHDISSGRTWKTKFEKQIIAAVASRSDFD